MTEPLSILLLAAGAFFVAGFVKGVIGLGLPTVAIALLSVVLLPAEAAALLIVPSVVTNVWQALAGRHIGALLRRLWPLLLAMATGGALVILAGGAVLTGEHAGRAAMALGAVLMLYAALGLSAVRFAVPPRLEPRLTPLIGVVNGGVTVATGVYVIPSAPYLQALGLDKDALVQALGLTFTVSTLVLAGSLAWAGAFRLSVAGDSLLLVLPTFAGMMAGQWLRGRVPQTIFRLCFFSGLMVLGVQLVLRSLV
ncbi:MAG: TSUP family transporter [Alphaproteobacteria bacterium]|jgi:uncharacterized membrane protein YfcA|nr:TSUP family transporter [Alphaproteobacteria bacterium]